MSTGRFGARARPSGSSGASLVALGLANPGREFAGTRHNVGGDAIEVLAARLGVGLKSEKGVHARVAAASAGSIRLVLAVSETYMNDSGLAAAGVVRRYLDGSVERLVVVHDELDLPPGVVRVKVGGGTAGHNGLRSIEQHLRSLAFCRVRVGIGKPRSAEQGADHVLSRPSRADAELFSVAREVAADAVELIATDGVEAAMTIVNARQ